MFDLNHLHQFIAVAEELHFGRAARRLNIAQPPLSQAIKRLEDRMGVLLFERTKRKVTLTPAGETLYAEAKFLIANAKRTAKLTRQSSKGHQGRITIGFVSAALYQVLPKALRSFRNRLPEASIELQEMTTNQQLDALERGRIDVGFGHPPVENHDHLTHRMISRDRLMAALPADHVLTAKRHVDFADLAKQPFVLFPAKQGPSLHAAIERACYGYGASLSVAAEATRIHTQLSLVAGGLGITLVPESAKSIRVKDVRYRRIKNLPESLYLEMILLYYQNKKRELLDGFLAAIDDDGSRSYNHST